MEIMSLVMIWKAYVAHFHLKDIHFHVPQTLIIILAGESWATVRLFHASRITRFEFFNYSRHGRPLCPVFAFRTAFVGWNWPPFFVPSHYGDWNSSNTVGLELFFCYKKIYIYKYKTITRNISYQKPYGWEKAAPEMV